MTAEHLAPHPVRRASPLAEALDVALPEVAAVPFSGAHRWWVATESGGIELRAPASPHVLVPGFRATRVSAGTALLAVRLAVAVSGSRPVTTLLPGGRVPGVLAIVRCGTPSGPTRAERVLFDALVRTRRPGSAVPVVLAMPQLRSAAEAEGAWLRTVADSAHGDRLRGLPPGDPAGTLPPGALLAVLGSHGELPAGDLLAGQGLQRLLCTARALGVAVTVLAGPTELAGRRHTGVPGAGPGLVPQVLLQVAPPDGHYADTVDRAATPRTTSASTFNSSNAT